MLFFLIEVEIVPGKFSQFVDICRGLPVSRPTTRDQRQPGNRVFSRMCVSICLGICKSAQHSYESQKILFVKNREGAAKASPR